MERRLLGGATLWTVRRLSAAKKRSCKGRDVNCSEQQRKDVMNIILYEEQQRMNEPIHERCQINHLTHKRLREHVLHVSLDVELFRAV